MSKLSFRARQVDYTKPLPIYLNHDLPDLQDFAAINRSVPQMPTGMEKDEEAEHHLQRALSALQAFGATSSNEYAIPTPKVEIDNKMYDRIYNIECPKQKQYIRIQPFSSDCDYPDYDADFDDESWVNEQKSLFLNYEQFSDDLMLFFETVMDRLEKATGYSTNLMSRDEAKFLLLKENNLDENSYFMSSILNNNDSLSGVLKCERDEFILSIYEYWRAKRLKLRHPLTPIVLTDKSGVATQPNNPYLVFRRRTEKMQTRKNRKNEEQSYEKMLILKRDLYRAQQIIKLIRQRENLKKEFLKLTLESFEKRFKLNDFDGQLADSIKTQFKPNQATPTPTSAASTSTSQSVNSHHHHQQNISLLNSKLQSITENNKITTSNTSSSSIDKTIANLILSNKFKLNLGQSATTVNKAPKLSSSSSNTITNQNLLLLNKQKRLKHQHQLEKEKTSKLNLSTQNVNNQFSNINQKLGKPAHLHTSTNQHNQHQRRLHTSIRRLVSPTVVLNKPVEAHTNVNKPNEGNDTTTTCTLIAEPPQPPVILQPIDDDDELTAYNEQLKQNDICNLDQLLAETTSKLSTSVESDGYWCFRRKEGCKYLAQSGPIFKHDSSALSEHDLPPNTTQSQPTTKITHLSVKRSRLRDLQRFYYGYAVTKQNRHLGLVRRRFGRGGRVLLERLNQHSIDMLKPTCSAPFNTYYPAEAQQAVVPDSVNEDKEESELSDHEHVFYDYRMFYKYNSNFNSEFTNHERCSSPSQTSSASSSPNTSMVEDDNDDDKLVKTECDFISMDTNFSLNDLDQFDCADSCLINSNSIKFDFSTEMSLNDELSVRKQSCEFSVNQRECKSSIRPIIQLKVRPKFVKTEPSTNSNSSVNAKASQYQNGFNSVSNIQQLNKLKNRTTLLLNNTDALNNSSSTISNLINQLNEQPTFYASSILPIINGTGSSALAKKQSVFSASSSSLASSSASSSSSSSSSPLSHNLSKNSSSNSNTNTSTGSSSSSLSNQPSQQTYLFASSQASLSLNGLSAKKIGEIDEIDENTPFCETSMSVNAAGNSSTATKLIHQHQVKKVCQNGGNGMQMVNGKDLCKDIT